MKAAIVLLGTLVGFASAGYLGYPAYGAYYGGYGYAAPYAYGAYVEPYYAAPIIKTSLVPSYTYTKTYHSPIVAAPIVKPAYYGGVYGAYGYASPLYGGHGYGLHYLKKK
ncbi:glycine-rich protein-like [Varroa jacobsoni]|uniref:Uncharacterized protein n=1 Tax=Varroa destructor TaxID=109461 RepID=A0A7M7JXF0_VARDE|nr:glycine-rich protein-like [Varroa destructor]XP_022698501.1 glycine-rich protein-like [Varroa jacobsoni]